MVSESTETLICAAGQDIKQVPSVRPGGAKRLRKGSRGGNHHGVRDTSYSSEECLNLTKESTE